VTRLVSEFAAAHRRSALASAKNETDEQYRRRVAETDRAYCALIAAIAPQAEVTRLRADTAALRERAEKAEACDRAQRAAKVAAQEALRTAEAKLAEVERSLERERLDYLRASDTLRSEIKAAEARAQEAERRLEASYRDRVKPALDERDAALARERALVEALDAMHLCWDGITAFTAMDAHRMLAQLERIRALAAAREGGGT
jgi:hypothetical protein